MIASGTGRQSWDARSLLQPGWLVRPVGTVALLAIIVGAAMTLSMLVWQALVGTPPL